jgi:hypothetical protein
MFMEMRVETIVPPQALVTMRAVVAAVAVCAWFALLVWKRRSVRTA